MYDVKTLLDLPMLKWLFKILFKIKGWKVYFPIPPEAQNSIVVSAPHTSNWDFVFAIHALQELGVNPRFTIKKEINRFPIGKAITNLGALWIDRKPKQEGVERQSMTRVMANLFKISKEPLCLLVTPEGTRSPNPHWRTGFYYAALEAKVPICLGFMDYARKETGIETCFMPSGDIQKDMTYIMGYYKDKTPKFPQNFLLDERYT